MFTPGPWTAGAVKMEEISFRGPYVEVRAKSKSGFITVEPAIAAGETEEEALENARIIVAAPKMHKILVDLQQALKDNIASYSKNTIRMCLSEHLEIINTVLDEIKGER